MSHSLNDAESLHTNQHDANVISPVLNSSDDAGQKHDKAKYPETSSASKQDKRHKPRKRKFPFIRPKERKTLQQREKKEVKVKARKKEKVPFIQLVC